MTITNDVLAKKLDEFTVEVRGSIQNLHDSQSLLIARLNSLDLNGSAETLRIFGRWLKDHPDFMIREAESLLKQEEKEQALRWLSEFVHFPLIKRASLWLLSAIAAGFLIAVGTDLYTWKTAMDGLLHHMIGIH